MSRSFLKLIAATAIIIATSTSGFAGQKAQKANVEKKYNFGSMDACVQSSMSRGWDANNARGWCNQQKKEGNW